MDKHTRVSRRAAGAMVVATAASLVAVNWASAKTVLRVHHYLPVTRGSSQLYEAIAKEYEKLHPGIDVKFEMTDYYDPYVAKIIAQAAAGVAPDIMIGNNFTFPRHTRLLADLYPFMKQTGFSIDSIAPSVRDAFEVDGKMLLLPYNAGAEALFFNAQLLKEKGLAVPQDDWNMTDFREYLTKLTSIVSGKVVTTGAEMIGVTSQDIWWLWAYGSGIVDRKDTKFVLDGPQGVAALTEYADLFQRKLIGGNWQGGKAGFASQGPWMINQYRVKFPFSVVPVPTGPVGKKVTSVYPGGWGITTASKHKAQAWDLIRFFMNKENQIRLAPFEGPVLLSALADPRTAQTTVSELKSYRVFSEGLGYGRTHYISRKSDRVVSVITDSVRAAVEGRVGVAQALANCSKAAVAALKN